MSVTKEFAVFSIILCDLEINFLSLNGSASFKLSFDGCFLESLG